MNWIKSTRSNATGNSVYVDRTSVPGFILVRESIQDHMGDAQPILRVPAESWSAFLEGVKAGEFDLISA